MLDSERSKKWREIAKQNNVIFTNNKLYEENIKLIESLEPKSREQIYDIECIKREMMRKNLPSDHKNVLSLKNVLKCAKQGSLEAIKILESLRDFENGVQNFEKKEYEKAISLMAKSLKSEITIINLYKYIYERLKIYLEFIIKSSNNESNKMDEDVRFIYGTLIFSNLEEVYQFLKISLKKYPKSISLLQLNMIVCGYLNKCEEGYKNSILARSIEPDNVDYIYMQAKFESDDINKLEDAIETFNLFLSKAERDHHKIPNTYYTLGLISIMKKSFEDALKYYEEGIKSEKNQILFTNSVPANKEQLKMFLSLIKSDLKQSISKQKRIMEDISRKEIILNYREYVSKRFDLIFDSKKKSKTYFFKHSHSEKTQKFPERFIGLKKIFIKDLDLSRDHILKDSILELVLIERPWFFDPSFKLIGQDENNNIIRVHVYNDNEYNDPNQLFKKYEIGTKITLLSPYVRTANDDKSGIRVDNPRSIIFLEKKESICRTCGEENGKFKCSRCMKSIYCSKECQTFDWKELKHKIICDYEIMITKYI